MSGTPDRTFACNLRVRSAALYTLSYGSVEKWCAGAVLPRLPPQCQSGDLLMSYRRDESGGPGWACTINLLGQSQALCWLSYGATKIRLSVLPRSGLAYKASASAALPSRNENGGSRRTCSPFHKVERSAFEAVPVRLPGSTSKNEIGGSPRCCPVLCGLRIRCITAMLATRKSGSQWTCSTTCDCRSVRLPTGGGTLVRFGFRKNWRPRMDSHHQPPESESGALLIELRG